ncbi:MAG TPA: hypothetical protein VNV16_15715 [Methylibium sp.]|jgi:hypothetical protein|nr:hypothetical protein [Methylibium sp.]
MHFEERDEAGFRIYAGAMETPSGYTAAVAVRHLSSPQPLAVVYRDEAMAGGYAWFQASDALQYAITNAMKWVRRQSSERLLLAD